MTVLAVVAIVVAVAAPDVARAIRRERARSARETIPVQLELVLKEGRNRLLPIEIDVDSDAIYYRFSPEAQINFSFDSCEGSGGATGACTLRQDTCAVLTDDRTPECARIATSILGLLNVGDLDGAISLWPRHKRASIVPELLSDSFPASASRIHDPLISFDTSFVDFPHDARLMITPLGAVFPIAGSSPHTPRQIRLHDSEGGTLVMEILDSGVVRVLP